MFVYLGSVDVAGHRYGFHPSVPQYKESLEIVDGQIGRIVSALHKRPHYDAEHWLVLVATDHGGQGTSHSAGQNIPETHTVFLIVSGPDAARGKIDGPTAQVDVVATALAHMGVAIDPKWQLDGRPVGLKEGASK
jgi:arylsulfatase A-like enzyme